MYTYSIRSISMIGPAIGHVVKHQSDSCHIYAFYNAFCGPLLHVPITKYVIVTTGLLGRNVFIVLALGRFAPSGLVQ